MNAEYIFIHERKLAGINKYKYLYNIIISYNTTSRRALENEMLCSCLHCSIISADRSKILTRKLSYRKGDRAMRPIYGCPENFRESLSTPTATFPEIFNGLLSRSIL